MQPKQKSINACNNLKKGSLMDNEKDIEFIDNFLTGKLNSQEVEDFNKRLSEDLSFKKEYELLSGISASFNRTKLKNELADLESKIQQEEKFTDSKDRDVFLIKSSNKIRLFKNFCYCSIYNSYYSKHLYHISI